MVNAGAVIKVMNDLVGVFEKLPAGDPNIEKSINILKVWIGLLGRINEFDGPACVAALGDYTANLPTLATLSPQVQQAGVGFKGVLVARLKELGYTDAEIPDVPATPATGAGASTYEKWLSDDLGFTAEQIELFNSYQDPTDFINKYDHRYVKGLGEGRFFSKSDFKWFDASNLWGSWETLEVRTPSNTICLFETWTKHYTGGDKISQQYDYVSTDIVNSDTVVGTQGSKNLFIPYFIYKWAMWDTLSADIRQRIQRYDVEKSAVIEEWFRAPLEQRFANFSTAAGAGYAGGGQTADGNESPTGEPLPFGDREPYYGGEDEGKEEEGEGKDDGPPELPPDEYEPLGAFSSMMLSLLVLVGFVLGVWLINRYFPSTRPKTTTTTVTEGG